MPIDILVQDDIISLQGQTKQDQTQATGQAESTHKPKTIYW